MKSGNTLALIKYIACRVTYSIFLLEEFYGGAAYKINNKMNHKCTSHRSLTQCTRTYIFSSIFLVSTMQTLQYSILSTKSIIITRFDTYVHSIEIKTANLSPILSYDDEHVFKNIFDNGENSSVRLCNLMLFYVYFLFGDFSL